MGWRSAWAHSRVAYDELAFQAIYSLRQGSLLPAGEDPHQLPAKARRRVVQSKFLVSLLLTLVTLGSLLALTPYARGQFAAVPPTLYVGAVVMGLLLLEIALLWTTGLQLLPTFLASRVLPLFETLPIAARDRDRIAFLLFLRLFDAPALTCLVLTPLAVGVALRSPLAGAVALPGVIAAILVAMSLAIVTSRFFVRRVQGARGGRQSALLRWLFLVLWAVPAFATYGFISFSPEFLRALAVLAQAPGGLALRAVVLLFPFPLALLPALVAPTLGPVWPGLDAPAVLSAALAYGFAVAFLGYRLFRAPRRLAQTLPEAPPRSVVEGARLAPGNVEVAILLKDLRTASRTPGYAFLILLPLLNALLIGLSSYVGNPHPSDVFVLGAVAVATAALLATFFGPAFFATEVMGYSYSRTLPLSPRALLLGKASLIVLIYLLASAAVLGLTLLRVFTPLLFLAFVIAELPGLVAAAFVELGLLFRRARKTGTPLTNLATTGWWATAVVVPGLLVASLPLVVFFALHGQPGRDVWAVPGMALLALGELALFAPLALGLPGRGRR